jgi:hypothetical protein
MLARSGRLPSGDYAYEVKWDGFRAIVVTEGLLRVRSRRGWDMTEHVGFLTEHPVRAVLDGEPVALDEDGKPDFPQLCECVLMRHGSIPLTFMAFDVLSVEGEPVVNAVLGATTDPRGSYDSTHRTGERRRPSTTARPCGLPSASMRSRASSRSGVPVAMSQVEEPGSRRRTATTGATRWSAKVRTTSSAHANSSER